MQTKSYTLNFLFLLGISLFISSCDEDEEPPAGPAPGSQTITQIVAGNANYSELREALVAAGLDGTLNTDGPFTVFAPDNNAFNNLFDALGLEDANGNGSRVDEAVDALGADALTQVLLYHVLDGETRAAGVPVKAYLDSKSTNSPDGSPIDILLESRSTGVFVNNGRSFGTAAQNTGANVVVADILASNGVVHGVNAVMLLPTVFDVAINNPAIFSGYVNLAVISVPGALSVADTLRIMEETTLFIPHNPAFTALNDSLLFLQQLGLSSVLAQHHFGFEQVKSGEFEDDIFFTANFQDLFTTPGDPIIVTDAAGGDANIISPFDIQATNGVVHTVDEMLIPLF